MTVARVSPGTPPDVSALLLRVVALTERKRRPARLRLPLHQTRGRASTERAANSGVSCFGATCRRDKEAVRAAAGLSATSVSRAAAAA
jgi:hypothetical protein